MFLRAKIFKGGGLETAKMSIFTKFLDLVDLEGSIKAHTAITVKGVGSSLFNEEMSFENN